ncbi:uncharacterized protein BO97DRAFT_212554 [Aspergillus homomorphus CBS 101889]|uniref:Uncharacterized protein n=1 Tax=Aspergillus homomorphus (strain CBS 101889) TaxID=1450537 RepID=A0A395IBB5_ASPHC|nr:hypothetical protein BO97DRAFT_212554 [Aspergillus homomorphus CBS 101889]RAL15454.1 hypothetical protein BO97DRAFT_212554 [Aspergillus homomorphus CBS 101889]
MGWGIWVRGPSVTEPLSPLLLDIWCFYVSFYVSCRDARLVVCRSQNNLCCHLLIPAVGHRLISSKSLQTFFDYARTVFRYYHGYLLNIKHTWPSCSVSDSRTCSSPSSSNPYPYRTLPYSTSSILTMAAPLSKDMQGAKGSAAPMLQSVT